MAEAIPPGLAPDLARFLTDLEGRVAALETPAGPRPAYVTTSSQLTVANAAQSPNCWAILTDLKTAAWSTGSHWLRFDTGAQIV